ncbi:T6SS effector BTH_I2691 family protein [Pantoea sp. SO10]|uniref:T6SS effector BTH_I2691 family protein n=1 Tax=Pantoea sp. SO10 TaxID=2575375 RepID=UPI0010C96E23|nr:T6SS effector BTH_I2691 family protein [Pantoea sp. SO10]QCP58813.1 hypothetical protein FCN45_05225 [Pantoea sp. SO10]
MSASCTTCLNTGPVLMPLRYAIVPDFVSHKLPDWAAPATAFPALNGYHYALRCVRQGFIYVYYDTGTGDLLDWEVWNIDESGDLYWSSNVLSARAVFNPLPCGRPIHRQANLEHMALNENALSNETWVAFSHAPWTKETIERYTRDPAERKLRMQNIQPGDWTAVGATFGDGLCRADESMLDPVLDYRPNLSGSPKYPLCDSDDPLYRVSYIEAGQYHFYADKVRPHTTFHPWVRNRKVQGAAARTMKAMQSRSLGPGGKPVNPLMIALKDPAGIAHELTSWCDGLALAHQTYLEELNVEFWTWRNINGVRSQVEQMTTAKQQQYAKEKGESDLQMLQIMKNAGYTSEQIQQFHDGGTRWANQQGMAFEWQKYEKKLNHAKFNQFISAYDQLCQTLDQQMNQLVGLRLAWLQDKHFLQCLDDHHTNVLEDNLNYREIVGYAISAINVVPVGRKQIQAWVKEYNATNNSNLFWRRQFFNNPDVISETTPVLAQLKKDAQTEDRPANDIEKPAILATFKSFVGYLGKYNDACDRALDELGRDEKKALVSDTRKLMAKMDTGLTTFTTEVFNKSLLGNRLDSFSNLIYKTLFARDAGIAMYDIEVDIGRQMTTGPEGAWARRRAMWDERTKVRDEVANNYQRANSQHLLSTEGKKTIEVSRIKLLGTILSVWELYSQSKDIVTEGKGSASNIMSVGLFAASFGIHTVLPAMDTTVEVAEKSYPLATDRANDRLLKWSIRANAYGSIAAGLMVISDFGELGEIITNDGPVRWKGVGISIVKIVSDSAYTIQSSEELLRLLGKKTFQEIILGLAEESGGMIEKLIARRMVSSIAFLASWQVMTLIILAQVAIVVFSDDELQNWCEQCVFGTETSIDNTELMPASHRVGLTQEQEDKLVKALHETLGLPLTERVKQHEDAEKLKQLKAEKNAFQQVHN